MTLGFIVRAWRKAIIRRPDAWDYEIAMRAEAEAHGNPCIPSKWREAVTEHDELDRGLIWP